MHGCVTASQDINSIYNVLELLQGRARSTEALVMVKLDIARNRILTAGLIFSMASTCLTLGALVSGIFGESPPFLVPLRGCLEASLDFSPRSSRCWVFRRRPR